MQLSLNFALSELTHTPESLISEYELRLHRNLAVNILQPIRNRLGLPMHITSGKREESDYYRLLASGYNPSSTSDHFFGTPVKLTDPVKVKKFGNLYPFSVGAADVTVAGLTVEEVFRVIKAMVQHNEIKVGQLIQEYGSGKSWIHVSNPPTLVFSSEIEQFLGRRQFLVSNDGGKNYQVAA